MQRVGWVVIALVVATALLGFFGGGPVSRASAQGARVKVEYERFIRLGQVSRLRLTLTSGPSSRLELSRGYLESFRVEQITPEPREVAASEDWIIYSFLGDTPMTVIVDLTPESFGSLRGAVRGFGETLLFRQIAYP